jgi:UDP-N-acetylmuramate dehydrogenase
LSLHFLRDFPLAAFNTFGVSATAKQFAVAANEQSLMQWCAAHGRDTPPFLVGGGSNLLLTRDIEAPVIQIAPRGVRVVFDEGNTVLVEAMAGEPWHTFVLWTLAQGLTGLENLSLIPGFVGAAPVQNIGAYGVEIAESCENVMTVDTQSGEPREFRNGECAFAYRDSVFKRGGDGARDRYAITRVRFRLSRRFTPRLDYGDIKTELQNAQTSDPTAVEVSRAVIAIRSRKLPDPAVIGNAGSFFKNPVIDAATAQALKDKFPDMPQYPAASNQVKLAAGWLIEQAGWKGRRLRAGSAAAVHDQHALVLVNQGGATGAELWALAEAIQADVLDRFGVALEPEPRVV